MWPCLVGQVGTINICLHTFLLLARIPRLLAQSLGKDATLSDVLQTLDEHYGVVMKFDILSKELYSLKQGLREKVAEFRVHLL